MPGLRPSDAAACHAIPSRCPLTSRRTSRRACHPPWLRKTISEPGMPRSAPLVLPPGRAGQGLYNRHPFGPRWTGLRAADRAVGGVSAGDGYLEGLGVRCAAEGVVGVEDGLERE